MEILDKEQYKTNYTATFNWKYTISAKETHKTEDTPGSCHWSRDSRHISGHWGGSKSGGCGITVTAHYEDANGNTYLTNKGKEWSKWYGHKNGNVSVDIPESVEGTVTSGWVAK